MQSGGQKQGCEPETRRMVESEGAAVQCLCAGSATTLWAAKLPHVNSRYSYRRRTSTSLYGPEKMCLSARRQPRLQVAYDVSGLWNRVAVFVVDAGEFGLQRTSIDL